MRISLESLGLFASVESLQKAKLDTGDLRGTTSNPLL